MVPVSSRHNPIVKVFRALVRGRDEQGRWLLEGPHLVREALESGVRISTAAICPALAGRLDDTDALVTALEAAGATIVPVTSAVMSALSPVRTPSGIVAIAEPRKVDLATLLDAPPRLVLMLSGVQDPGNVGAVVRAAEAAGVSGLVVCERTADPFGWKALRGAMGSTFRVPIADRCTEAVALAAARAHGLSVIATVPRDGRPLYDVDLRRPTAVLVGGEGGGLSPAVVRSCDAQVSIPMRPPVESLNVAVSAALVLYEAYRQRHHAARRRDAGEDRHGRSVLPRR
jgi:TrmH family RNA methyltransferase